MAVTQRRHFCPDCRREVVFKTAAAGPAANCPACGSPNFEEVRYAGVFDLQTDPDEIARVMAGLPIEERDRSGMVGRQDVSEPPMALGVPVELLVSDARAQAGPTERAWPPAWAGDEWR